MIDTATNQKTWVPLPAVGYGTSPTPDRRSRRSRCLWPTNLRWSILASLTVVRTVDVPDDPVKVLARPDGKVAYVSCSKAKQIAARRLVAVERGGEDRCRQGCGRFVLGSSRRPKRAS